MLSWKFISNPPGRINRVALIIALSVFPSCPILSIQKPIAFASCKNMINRKPFSFIIFLASQSSVNPDSLLGVKWCFPPDRGFLNQAPLNLSSTALRGSAARPKAILLDIRKIRCREAFGEFWLRLRFCIAFVVFPSWRKQVR